tara:strand:- start:267 stop:1835 length:1569 start_codon:yes stop_codon:yes gene_type:complete
MKNIKDQIQSAVNIYKSGNLNKAEQVTSKLIANNPKIVFLYNLLGLILTGQNKIDKAIKCYEKGLKIDSNFAMLYNNLGHLFFSFESYKDIQKAEKYFKKSISLNSKLAEPHNNLGNLYKSLNKYDVSINCYKKAIENSPKLYLTHYNLGNTYVTMGKFGQAAKHFKEAIKVTPNFVLAHRGLSRITKYTKQNEHFNELVRIYNNTNIRDFTGKVEIAFSLGKAYEDIKSFDESFKFYNEANEIYRKKINFSITGEKKRFQNNKETFNKKLFEKYNRSGYSSTSPIFIVGMPRSGTTMIEQILSSHPKVFGADEIDFIPDLIKKNFGKNDLRSFFEGEIDFKEDSLRKIGKNYVHKIEKISNKSERTTDKLPVNFFSIGLIKLILPNSKIIHCYRHPKDNCFSIFKTHFTSGRIKYAYDLNEIVEYYKLYNDLMKYWNNVLPNFVYNIKYENLILDTESEIKNLVHFCNLKWTEVCLNFHNNNRPIRTASDTQARSKIYNTSIDSWKHYKKYLEKYFIDLKV